MTNIVREEKGRLLGLDAGRTIAAAGVVCIHVFSALRRWSILGRFAVPFFAGASAYLLIEGLLRKPERPAGAFYRSRFMRLYVPFLAWTAIYGVVRVAKSKAVGEAVKVEFGVSTFFDGTALHLWYLPFLFVLMCVLFPIGKWMGRSRGAATAGMVGALAGAVVMGAVYETHPLGWTSQAWAPEFTTLSHDALLAVFGGVALAVAWSRAGAAVRESRGLAAMAGVAAAGCVAWLFWKEPGLPENRNLVMENLAGLALLVWALGPWRGRVIGALAALGPISYGVYLVHELVRQGLLMAVTKLGHVQAPEESLGMMSGVFVGTLAGSLAMAWVLAQSRWTAWLVPGAREGTGRVKNEK